MPNQKLYVKQNEATIVNGTSSARAYIEREYVENGVKMVQVLVRDVDGGLAGPYRMPADYLEVRENAG